MRLFTAIVINLLLWGCESWTLTAGQRQSLNVRFNRWIRAMSRMTKLDLRNLSIRDKELRKRLGIESLSEILDRRCMIWMEKVANMPATIDDNRLPRKLLGVANGRLYANLISICCVNFNSTATTTQLYVAPKVT